MAYFKLFLIFSLVVVLFGSCALDRSTKKAAEDVEIERTIITSSIATVQDATVSEADTLVDADIKDSLATNIKKDIKKWESVASYNKPQ